MDSQLSVVENVVVEQSLKCGCIDEEGFLNSLLRQGYTDIKSISEILDNSVDANAKETRIEITHETINFIDDGRGMNIKNIEDMFAMQRSNHSCKKSIGVSGIGGKAATLILSQKENGEPTTVYIYTHTIDGEYYKIIVPWNEIFNYKIYTDKITCIPMNSEEITNFNKRSIMVDKSVIEFYAKELKGI